jgi:hypothetical protein
MEIKIKVHSFDKCADCGHQASDHAFGRGQCAPLFTKCGCAHFRPHEPQAIKELRWIYHNFGSAKTVPEAEKWKVKLNNWAKAHPEEYKAFLKDILEAFEKRTD